MKRDLADDDEARAHHAGSELAHVRRFSAHATIFLYLPLLSRGPLPALAQWRGVLVRYLDM